MMQHKDIASIISTIAEPEQQQQQNNNNNRAILKTVITTLLTVKNYQSTEVKKGIKTFQHNLEHWNMIFLKLTYDCILV